MLTPTDPLFTLQTPSSSSSKLPPSSGISAVTGVCFIRDPIRERAFVSSTDCSTSDDETDSNGSIECNFQCSDILLGPQHGLNMRQVSVAAATHSSASSHSNLQGGTLASCHHDGSCKIWDLSSRRCIVEDINSYRESGRKFGLAVRRIDRMNAASHQFLYQTRDEHGTVTLHDLQHDSTLELMRIETNSNGFCTMSPCQVGLRQASESESIALGGENNLVALPTEFHSRAVVRDLRCDPTSQPAFRVSIGREEDSVTNHFNQYGRDNKYGMLMSLALSLQDDTKKLVLGCGMEDGSVLFYDLGKSGKGCRPRFVQDANNSDLVENGKLHYNLEERTDYTNFMCTTKLGKEPVLSLDLTTSYADNEKHTTKSRPSLVAVAGCAGDVDEMSDLPKQEQGTVTTLKVILSNGSETDSTMKSTIRNRTHTCSLSSGGRVGVSITRFRPDGRVFAVGGWDRRLRIFGRTSSKPLAVLHGGHNDSVVAMDWAGNAATSGLLATGAADAKICVYRVLPHTLNRVHK